jgi:transposase
MIEHRRKLVSEQTRTKNGIRSLLRSQGVEAPRGLWTRRGLVWLTALQLATDLDELQHDILQERLQSVASMIQRVERVLNRMAAAHSGVQLLRTIPGVGPRTGEAVVAYIDEPGRFHRNKAIGSYFGLIPKQDASGRSNRLGHITREGPSLVRSLLVEAAWQGIRRCPQIRQVYERIMRDDKQRKKIALVATAHYLIRAMLAMLQTGEVWRYSAEAA